jgi:ribosomal protein S18 acetylase RimI-like enzyme
LHTSARGDTIAVDDGGSARSRRHPQDLPALVRGNAMMALETERLRLDRETLERGVAAVLEGDARGRYYVLEQGGEVVAQLMITYEWSDWRCRDVWWIQSVYVAPEQRRRGHYRTLYEHVIQEARRAGAGGVRLYVDQRNIRAQETYEALGMNGDHYRVFETMFDEPPVVT